MDQSLLRRPVYSKLLALYNNYDVSTEMPSSYFASQVDTTVKETVTRSELNEEEDFLDEVMKSDVMKETMRWHSCNSRLSQVSVCKAALHKVCYGVQEAAEGVLVHSLQQVAPMAGQGSWLKVGTHKV